MSSTLLTVSPPDKGLQIPLPIWRTNDNKSRCVPHKRSNIVSQPLTTAYNSPIVWRSKHITCTHIRTPH